MKQLNATNIFKKLVETIGYDNGGRFDFTHPQWLAGTVAIVHMQEAGIVFPDNEACFDDLDGIYWEIAAGEAMEKMEKYGLVPGYIELDRVLNEVFENPRQAQ